MKDERGFALLEVTIATALGIAFAFAVVGVLRGLIAATAMDPNASDGARSLDQQVEALRDDAATAFAAFVPARDVMRARNDDGHEIDFYTKTDAGASAYWAYYYDAATMTLRRYDYDRAGTIGEANRTTGAIDPAAQYPALAHVVSFAARTLEASDLAGPQNAYGAAVAPAFAGAPPRAFPIGFDDGGASRDDLYGGNTTVQIRIATERGARTLHLATAALPSGFTIRARPEFRAIVYRVDQTHRFLFGLAGKSHVFVKARLDVSYDGWRSPPIVWCDFDVYGYPGGLTGGAAENYHPEWFTESTAGIVYAVTHGQTPGASCPVAPPPAPHAAG